MDIIFQKAELSRLDDICRMFGDAMKNMESMGIYQWDEAYPNRTDFERDIKAGQMYVALDGSSIAASYTINTECEEEYNSADWQYPDYEYIVIHRLCVNPQYQNMKIGKRTVLHIEEQARNMGYKSIRLDTFSQNPYALKLYYGLMFRETGFADWRMGRFILMEKGIQQDCIGRI